MGRRIAMQSDDMGRKEYDYDQYGNLAAESDNVLRGKGSRINYVYDAMNRLIKIDYPQSTDTFYEYGTPHVSDGRANRIVKVTDETGYIEYKYGDLGETIEETRTITGVQRDVGQRSDISRTMQYTSNYLGQLETLVFDDGEVVSYSYNEGGQVRTVAGTKPSSGGSGNFPYVNDIGYDEFGQRVYIAYGNGVQTSYSYDENRRWLTTLETTDRNGRAIQQMTYFFDLVGNVIKYENKESNSFEETYTTTQTYEYDNLYQLTNVIGLHTRKNSSIQTLRSTYSQSYSFDSSGNGNMIRKLSTETTAGRRTGDNLNYDLDYQYYGGNTHRAERIGNMYYRYDGNGNLVTERFGGHATVNGRNAQVNEEGGVYSTDYGFALTNGTGQDQSNVYQRDFTWNERNQLVLSVDRQNAVEYRYGADGQRAIKRGLTTETLYFNRMYQLTYAPDQSSMGTNWVESKHIFVGETRIVTKRRNESNPDNYAEEQAKQYFYHGDHLGSAQMVSGSTGQVYEHIEYTPYGETWVEQEPTVDQTPFRFTGHEADEETGLIYFGARYLNPQTGMWLSADPAMGEYVPQAGKGADGLPGMGGVFNSVNFHAFAYAGNNPVKYIDPDGRFPWLVIPIIIIGVGMLQSDVMPPPPEVDISKITKALQGLHYGIPSTNRPTLSNANLNYRKTREEVKIGNSLLVAVGASLPTGGLAPSDYDNGRTSNIGTAMQALGLIGSVAERSRNSDGYFAGDIILTAYKTGGKATDWRITEAWTAPDGTKGYSEYSREGALKYLEEKKVYLKEVGLYDKINAMLNL
jgi:RHS repeat-associated protein